MVDDEPYASRSEPTPAAMDGWREEVDAGVRRSGGPERGQATGDPDQHHAGSQYCGCPERFARGELPRLAALSCSLGWAPAAMPRSRRISGSRAGSARARRGKFVRAAHDYMNLRLLDAVCPSVMEPFITAS